MRYQAALRPDILTLVILNHYRELANLIHSEDCRTCLQAGKPCLTFLSVRDFSLPGLSPRLFPAGTDQKFGDGLMVDVGGQVLREKRIALCPCHRLFNMIAEDLSGPGSVIRVAANSFPGRRRAS